MKSRRSKKIFIYEVGANLLSLTRNITNSLRCKYLLRTCSNLPSKRRGFIGKGLSKCDCPLYVKHTEHLNANSFRNILYIARVKLGAQAPYELLSGNVVENQQQIWVMVCHIAGTRADKGTITKSLSAGVKISAVLPCLVVATLPAQL